MTRLCEIIGTLFPSCSCLQAQAKKEIEISFHNFHPLNVMMGLVSSTDATRANSEDIAKVDSADNSESSLSNDSNSIRLQFSNYCSSLDQLQYLIGDTLSIVGLNQTVSLYILIKPGNRIFVFKKIKKSYFKLFNFKVLNENANIIASNALKESTNDFLKELSLRKDKPSTNYMETPKFLLSSLGKVLEESSLIIKDCDLPHTMKENQFVNKPYKLYYRINGMHYLHNDTQTFLVIGDSYILSIYPFNSGSDDKTVTECSELFQSDTSMISETKSTTPKIKIELLRVDSSKSAEYLFSIFDFKITIGRSSFCDIQCLDHSVSKVHSTIFYCTSSRKWILLDGHENTLSTNGNWLLVNRPLNCEFNEGTRHFLRYGQLNACFEYK